LLQIGVERKVPGIYTGGRGVAGASALHHRLSERSIYLRFFGAKPEPSGRKAAYFTNVNWIERFALVVVDPEHPEEIRRSRTRNIPK